MTSKAARALLVTRFFPKPDSAPPQVRKALSALSPDMRREVESQASIDLRVSRVLEEITVPDEAVGVLAGQGQAIRAAHSRGHFSPRDPAMLSVLIGVLALGALLAWHFLGRAGEFPEEALTIAAEGVKLRGDQFEVVEEPVGELADWFLLKGFDRFRVPAQFAQYKTAGARIFKIENRPVAVLAVPENSMFFLVFDPALFGIRMAPGNEWRTAEFDHKYAAAIREDGGMCFLVVIQGAKKDLLSLLHPSARKPK